MTTTELNPEVKRGHGSDERPVTRDLWARDSRKPNVAMQEFGDFEPSNPKVDYKRYYDADFAKREFEQVWMKSWLYVAREEDLPNIGDRTPVQIGPMSFIIIRTGADSFKALHNSCLHRGTKLCSKPESGDKIVCPFHAWEWKIDGALSHIPSHWDFTAVTRANGQLGEVRLDRWGGFIFINASAEGPSLLETLGPIPRHFADFAPESRYTAAHFRRLMPANWKVVQEAFQESYHVLGTHPEGVPYNGDSQAQYEIWESDISHVARFITPSAVPSMLAGPEASTFEAAMVYAHVAQTWHYPDAPMPELDPARDLRAQIAEWHRTAYAQRYGRTIDAPDAVMLDSTLYYTFPHMGLWLSETIPFAYQFTPHETNPEMSYFDVRMMLPIAEGEARPAPSPRIDIGPDEAITDKAPAFAFLAHIFDQDVGNMPLIQQGVRSADPARPYAQLGTYQEMIIQHWNALIDKAMAD